MIVIRYFLILGIVFTSFPRWVLANNLQCSQTKGPYSAQFDNLLNVIEIRENGLAILSGNLTFYKEAPTGELVYKNTTDEKKYVAQYDLDDQKVKLYILGSGRLVLLATLRCDVADKTAKK